MEKLKHVISALLLFLFSTILTAQQVIHLTNPSFEDSPQHSRQPRGWFDCGDANESPPDVQPYAGFGVTKFPYEGNTYVAMVVRDNNTTEAIGQRLPQVLKAGKCYVFSLILCRSGKYLSMSRRTEGKANFIEPAKVRIWGGDAYCDAKQFLGETVLIDHEEWKEYVFSFAPKADVQYIAFETYYQEPLLFPYNGNILMDSASPIVEVSCKEETSVNLQDFYKKETSSIQLENASFEQETPARTMAKYWQTCNGDNNLVNLEPANTRHRMPAPYDSINYISLRVDDNTLTGAISKNLKPYLQPQQCYSLSFYAARADWLLGRSPFLKNQVTNFDGFAKIKIWGGNMSCEKEDLLAETPVITHQEWKQYQFILQPEHSYSHLRIEAAYATPISFFYNGNVLLDALSDIQLLNCDSLEYYHENIQNTIPSLSKTTSIFTGDYPWKNAPKKPKDKAFKSYTYSVRDSEESINENLLPILAQAYPKAVLLFNIFAPTKEDGKFQEDLLIKTLKELGYPKHWYKTKTYLED